ncbi:DNA glycosylase AlkZ-like family protein [Haloechinothrix sp. LS1_15]|uniref:winged helix-turn-helix domain-containing protein n=1 Tax=Haloechinothrix sp. LS1_15 TaxID=2652248 RepID=UPI0029453E00|nr:crosslink repair DNA glycosylase YcaQ family protein [Haloechinothrix sp. LS1_15]MDV6012152.1 winged helix-turn-helix domain-containing protein [Haloechinothrix sp. LS1_15]
MRTISSQSARRIALAAQGFADRAPRTTPTRTHLRRVLSRTQLFQLDSVNVAFRAHYAPLLARLGPYPTRVVDDAAWSDSARRPRMLVEYWAHEASLIPVEDWPLLRFRMRDLERHYREHPRSVLHTSDDAPRIADEVRAAVKEFGPIGAGALERELGRYGDRRTRGTWWDRSDVKRVCEWLFAIGELTTGTRRGFERCYDLPERVLPSSVLTAGEIDTADAVRELTAKAAVALGIATEGDLRDYYRIEPARSKRAVAELVEDGVLEPVAVQGWREQAYRHAAARVPRAVTGRALLCPFDPLIFNRERTRRLFGFHYRIEIYVPASRRTYGYYVFPFLLDGSLVARVDLKSDRTAGVLRVQGAFAEPGVDLGRVAAELAGELRSTAEWLGLGEVVVAEHGDLAGKLRSAVRGR